MSHAEERPIVTEAPCRCGHLRADHDFDGWGQLFACLAYTYDGPMGTIICGCTTWAPVADEVAVDLQDNIADGHALMRDHQ